MDYILPPELVQGAICRDKEYAWDLAEFPSALDTAARLGYACLGGQFWFLLPDNSLYEPYWLDADSTNRRPGEPWGAYARRSCKEVLDRFNTLVDETDFAEEALKFSYFEPLTMDDFGSTLRLLFNGYFISEQEFTSLYIQRIPPPATLLPESRPW